MEAHSCCLVDVVEINADPTGQHAGSKFVVDGTHQFSDLDELIVNHVQAMARKVEELMMHEGLDALNGGASIQWIGIGRVLNLYSTYTINCGTRQHDVLSTG